MKKYIALVVVLGFAGQAWCSEVIPPRIVVKWLIKAVQEQKSEVAGAYFKFDAKQHVHLTPLSRAEQLALLKDLPLDAIKFDRDEYAVDKGTQFVVRVLAPKALEFEMRYVELKAVKEVKGPPWMFEVVAIRESAQRSPAGDAQKAASSPQL